MAALKALVLDDDELTRNLFVEILRERQVEAFVYADPTDFMKEHRAGCCRKQKPCFDAILTDNKMLKMTGLAFLKQVEEIGCLIPKEQTAIISGDWSVEDLERAQTLGCQIFEKPCNIERILNWIDTLQPIST